MTEDETRAAIIQWAQGYFEQPEVQLLGIVHQQVNDTWEALLTANGRDYDISVFFWFAEENHLHIENVTRNKPGEALLASLLQERDNELFLPPDPELP